LNSAILNPQSRYYRQLKQIWSQSYEDNFWAEDAIFLERNSRDFVSRIDRINDNAEAICEVLREHPRGKAKTEMNPILEAYQVTDRFVA
jgi:cystathionine gamma-synthase